jgi:hypothetical protein
VNWTNVYASPDGVPASIVRLNEAEIGGETRSSFGTNSRKTALPPGVQSATFFANLGLPGGGSAMSDCIVDGTLPGASAEVTCALMQVGPRFFETTSTSIVAGRAFAPGDEPPAAQVAIINETMAHQYFGGTSPLGQRIQGKVVVGVARDTKHTSLREPAPRMASSFGLLALVLACIGLYGTMSFAVARRTNEIGARLALGATRARIIGGLMIEFGTPVAIGAAAGIAATVTVSRLLTRFLFGLAATDPATLGAAVVVLGLAAASAAILPARRASGTDPLVALRAE